MLANARSRNRRRHIGFWCRHEREIISKARLTSLDAKKKIKEIANEGSCNDDIPDIPSLWSSGVSAVTSASDQLAIDLDKKVQFLQIANDKLRVTEERCVTVTVEINASKKRFREECVMQTSCQTQATSLRLSLRAP